MSTNICLKEWSGVIEALGTGQQILVVHGFQPRYDEVILYPTFSFYTKYMESLEERFQSRYIEMVRKSGIETTARGKQELLVDLKYSAKVDGCYTVSDAKSWKALENEYIWTSKHVIDYAESKSGKAFLWLLRVYKLAKPEVVGRWNMGGPPDYYRHNEDLSTKGAIPVLSDSDYNARKENILKLVSKAVSAR